MNKPYILLAVLVALACGKSSPPSLVASPSTSQASQASLEGTWKLVTLEGTPIVKKERFNISFKGDAVSGGGGCNNFWGTAKRSGSQLVLETAATERGCDLGIQETAYYEALHQTRAFTIVGNVLELRSASGAKLVSFER